MGVTLGTDSEKHINIALVKVNWRMCLRFLLNRGEYKHTLKVKCVLQHFVV